jgi:hypothetical protein
MAPSAAFLMRSIQPFVGSGKQMSRTIRRGGERIRAETGPECDGDEIAGLDVGGAIDVGHAAAALQVAVQILYPVAVGDQ